MHHRPLLKRNSTESFTKPMPGFISSPHTHTHTHTYTYADIQAHAHTYIYTYIDTYTHTHLYLRRHTLASTMRFSRASLYVERGMRVYTAVAWPRAFLACLSALVMTEMMVYGGVKAVYTYSSHPSQPDAEEDRLIKPPNEASLGLTHLAGAPLCAGHLTHMAQIVQSYSSC